MKAFGNTLTLIFCYLSIGNTGSTLEVFEVMQCDGQGIKELV
jgi:hypothetical protein